ncbi:MAG: hypothetical protein ACM3SY_22695 [Candidatus Omnitrophota bacterium]
MTKKLKFSVLLCTLAIAFGCISPALHGAEADSRNLSGMTYVRLKCEFNGTPYFRGFKNTQSQQPEEFNIKELEAKLKGNPNGPAFPLSLDHIRSFYSKLETMLTSEGIRILEVIPDNSDGAGESTIIPTVNLEFDVREGTKDLYFVSMALNVDKWISSWVDDRSVQTPVLVWWQKRMVVANSKELVKTMDTTTNELIGVFLTQLKGPAKTVPLVKDEKNEKKAKPQPTESKKKSQSKKKSR